MAKKLRMGRGLDVLYEENTDVRETVEETANETSDNGVKFVRLSLVEPNKGQPREEFDEEKLGELADSIKENGVLQPILVRPLENGGYQIVAGERRWRASRLAGLTEIPVLIKELTDKQTMQIALIENIQRQDLNPLEEAAAYKNLMDTYSMTQQEISEAVGKSRSVIANSLRLMGLSEFVKQMISRKELTVGHAKVLCVLDEVEQLNFAMMTVANGYSVRQLEELVANRDKDKSKENDKERKFIKENSFAKDRPFIKEFEVSVNNNSNIKVTAKAENDGGAKLSLKIGKDCDIEQVLSRLADLLTNY